MPSDAIDAQLEANDAALRRTRARLVAFATSLWFGLGSWNVPDVERFVAVMLPAVLAAQRTTAALTDLQLALLAARFFGTTPAPLGLDLAQFVGAKVRTADPELVYRRPGAVVWDALGKGEPLEVGVEQGAKRIASLVATDLQLAKTHAARAVMTASDSGTGYFRRVLKGDKSCGLCALTSTRRYRTEDLLPIHPGCDCDVEPLLGDPDLVIDQAELDRIHGLAREFFGESRASGIDRRTGEFDYRDFVIVHEHGEYGPVLARTGDHFTGAAA